MNEISSGRNLPFCSPRQNREHKYLKNYPLSTITYRPTEKKSLTQTNYTKHNVIDLILTAGLIVNVRKPSTSPDIKHRLQKISFQLDILSLFNHTAIDGGPQVDFLIFFSFF